MAAPTLVALGDSLTQGFQNAAISRTSWSFPAILARSLGHEVPGSHRIPDYGSPGYPLNIEDLLGVMAASIGESFEAHEFLTTNLTREVRNYLDRIEDYYERGEGWRPLAEDEQYHNLAVWGFTVNEALTLTSDSCRRYIDEDEGWIKDDFLGIPSTPMHRAALRVLNPANRPARRGATMVQNLRALAASEPIDLLIVWLGANDCLGTVLDLEIREMPDAYTGTDPFARREFNLTSVAQFRRDYRRLVDAIAEILEPNPGRCQVYVGTVPHVTIPPVTSGIGELRDGYFDHYARFFRNDTNFTRFVNKALTRANAMYIDTRVNAFNDTIEELVCPHGWTVVHTSKILDCLAIKRNGYIERPDAALRHYLGQRGRPDHPLLALDPVPSILPYAVGRTEAGYRRVGGGLFGLDYIHPTTLGYALIAERFLEAIQANNSEEPALADARIDWGAILLEDSLEQTPPVLWDDFARHAHDNAWLWEIILCSLTNRGL